VTTKHLVLVGLMGAGKTTVGERCADQLGRPFVDTDELVEGTVHLSVGEIFEQLGEEQFRALERTAVADVSASPAPLVIACGGGAVLDADSRARLRATGTVVWLQAPPAVLGARVVDQEERDGASRPLVRGDGPLATIERLAITRAPAYEAAAHAAVDTTGKSVDEVVDAVLDELHAWSERD
jgi:shikimate kinase